MAFLPQIPSDAALMLLASLAVLLVLFLRKVAPSWVWPVLFFAGGGLYASLHAASRLADRLPSELTGVEVALTGTVVDLPSYSGRRLRFLCAIESLKAVEGQSVEVSNGTLRLNWYGAAPPDLKAGDRINIVAKLKAPAGFMNPGGFDYERWLMQKGIIATGYVRSKSFDVSQTVVASDSARLDSLRHRLQRRMLASSDGLTGQGVMLALSVGDRQAISKQQWQTFIATGTNHLLAISGLHISLVAGFFTLVVHVLWRFSGLANRISRQACALLVALVAVGCYAAMAGFTVPTVRALTMFIVLAVLLMARRHQRRLQALSVALIIVCLSDPLSVLSPGFWMSFFAVAVLYVVFCNAELRGNVAMVKRILRGHLLVSVGLYPLTVLFFQQASLIAPVANLLVMPVVGFLVTPLVFIAALISVFSVSGAAILLSAVNYLIEFSLWLLRSLAEFPQALIKFSGVSTVSLALASVTACVLLVPVPKRIRLCALLLLLPLFYPLSNKLDNGQYVVTFLDVGQGTSVVVRTRNHVLVYDTGDQFGDRSSAADTVVIPFLRSINVRSIDTLIVSHADRDHSGGADELLDNFDTKVLMSSAPLPQRPLREFEPCVAGTEWIWDQVHFRLLHPATDASGSENDLSCVLQISTSTGQRTLLTGDIESRAERRLINSNLLRSVVVMMSPHHGSASSSGQSFIDALSPDYVVHTAGYRNRFGFPRQEVLDRYAASGARQFTTSESGAVEFSVSDASVTVAEYRATRQRWWHRNTLR